MKKKVRNPLIKRIPKELLGDWRKYLVVALFLILTIGFVAGMYVANESMMIAADTGVTKYKLEDGHFELKTKADEALISAIEAGEKADIKQYYLDKAKEELDEKFDSEFEDKFTVEFDGEFEGAFAEEFDSQFTAQVKQSILAQGLDEASAEAMLAVAIAKAKEDGTYKTAYDSAYQTAYETAYDEAYDEAYEAAYDEAWDEICDEIDEKYADAQEKYELDDADFKAVPVVVYENFYRNEDEDYNNDGTVDGTIRIYAKTRT